MKLTVHTFTTVDGVMQGPGGAEEDPSGGFTRGGWMVPYADGGFGEIVNSWFHRADEILLGRSTYDMMSAYWSQVTDPDNTVGEKLNGLPKYVASTTLTDPTWPNTTVLSDRVVEQIAELKARPGGELQVHGSCGLIHSLQAADLIDEYRMVVFPVAVGAGKRLFSDDMPATGFSLVESRTTDAGAVYSVLARTAYAGAGEFSVVGGKEEAN